MFNESRQWDNEHELPDSRTAHLALPVQFITTQYILSFLWFVRTVAEVHISLCCSCFGLWYNIIL